jgi:glutaredoxin/SH3-like domain-containing protein
VSARRIMVALALIAAAASARAETLYVAERMLVALRAEASDSGPAVKTVETGVPLEVLERQDRYVHVRDKQGVDGWVEARDLSPDPPARLQLAALQQELARSRAQTADAQGQLKQARATVAEQMARIAELEKAAAENPPTRRPGAASGFPAGGSIRAQSGLAGDLLCYAWDGIRRRCVVAARVHSSPLRRHVSEGLIMDAKKIWAAVLVTALGTALGTAGARGERLYKWIDKDGNVSYHDRPPADAGYRVEQRDLGGGRHPQDDSAGNAAEKYPVVLYSVPGCDACDLARQYLQKRKVPFTEQNVEKDPVLQEQLKKKAGALSVPTITIGEKVMRGYVESVLAGELDDAGYPKMPPAAGDAAGVKPDTENLAPLQ